MKLYNKSVRAFIINKVDAVDGCRFPTDIMSKEKAYIDPDTTVEVSDVLGTKLLSDYPAEIMKIEGSTKNRIKDKVEKKEVKKAVKKTKLRR